MIFRHLTFFFGTDFGFTDNCNLYGEFTQLKSISQELNDQQVFYNSAWASHLSTVYFTYCLCN